VLNIALKVLTYFYGALLGTFLLGAFTRRGSGTTVIAGMLLGVVTVLVLQLRHFIEDPSLAPESVRRSCRSCRRRSRARSQLTCRWSHGPTGSSSDGDHVRGRLAGVEGTCGEVGAVVPRVILETSRGRSFRHSSRLPEAGAIAPARTSHRSRSNQLPTSRTSVTRSISLPWESM